MFYFLLAPTNGVFVYSNYLSLNGPLILPAINKFIPRRQKPLKLLKMNASKVELIAILFQALTAGSLFLYNELNDTPSISIICVFLANANS